MSDFRLPSKLVAGALLLGCAAPTLQAAPRPLRLAYLDVSGAERSKKGLLNDLMRELGRDALFFDYYGVPADFTNTASFFICRTCYIAKRCSSNM